MPTVEIGVPRLSGLNGVMTTEFWSWGVTDQSAGISHSPVEGADLTQHEVVPEGREVAATSGDS